MASKFANKAFWTDTFDRAVASFAQGVIGTAGLDTVGLISVDWVGVASLAGSYALLSVLTSIAFRGGQSTELTDTEREADKQAKYGREGLDPHGKPYV